MTRGAYIARLDLDEPHLAGVVRKITAQRAALAVAGLPSTFYAMRSGAIVSDADEMRPAGGGALDRRLAHYLYFHRTVARDLGGAAFLYLRFQGAGPGLLRLLSRFRARNPRAPILMEIPTWPYRGERHGPRQHVLGLLDDLSAPHLHRYVDRIVTFSGEERILGIPTIRTRNGVDLASIPVAPTRRPQPPLRLVAVANLGVRHAYDRMIDGLARYRAAGYTREILFDVIGSGAAGPGLQALAQQRGVADMVHFPGPMNGPALDERMGQAHMGIAALGMHRIKADTSDLKSREYCARGLPFLTSNPDADFPDDCPFVLRASADDSPIDIAAVVAFLDGRDHDSRAIRQHAETHLTWHAKMAPVVDWLHARGAA